MPIAATGSDIRFTGLERLSSAPSSRSAVQPQASDYKSDWSPASATASSGWGGLTSSSLLLADFGPLASPSASSTPSAPTPSPSPGQAPLPPGSSYPTHPPAAPTSATPTPGPSSPAPASPAETAAQRTELTNARTDAELSKDVYQDTPNPPAGYHVADTQELSKLGLTPQMLTGHGTDFRARVYVGPAGRTVVAFKGTKFTSGSDWKNNIKQAIGKDAPYYDRAIDIGQRIARSGQQVVFTGHSLGGGLASAASIASGDEGDTFNAAGLSKHTITEATDANEAAGQGGRAGHVDAYYDGGDPLSGIQDAGPVKSGLVGGIIGGVLGGLFGGPPGAALGVLLGGGAGVESSRLPSAYGDRHELPTINPPGSLGLNPIAKHGLDYIERGLNQQLSELH